MQLEKIPRSMHADVIGTYWLMLQELEAKADNDRVLQVMIEGIYRQWNRMTQDDKVPKHILKGLQQKAAAFGENSNLLTEADLANAPSPKQLEEQQVQIQVTAADNP